MAETKGIQMVYAVRFFLLRWFSNPQMPQKANRSAVAAEKRGQHNPLKGLVDWSNVYVYGIHSCCWDVSLVYIHVSLLVPT